MNIVNKLKQREPVLALMIVALVLLVGLRAPIFLTTGSLANLLTDSTLLVMLALTQMLVIVTRGIDLPVASTLALCGMAAAMLASSNPALRLIVVMLAATISGLLLGLINGWPIGYSALPPIMVTLGTMSLYRGLVLVRYLGQYTSSAPRTVLSTGTWLIAAAFGTSLDGLREDADMLANTSAKGQPVACMRFMGGREFAALAGDQPAACSYQQLEKLVSRGTMALPCFTETGGPFAGRPDSIEGPAPVDAGERFALATLYCVLMTDYGLDAPGARGPITVEGNFTANPWFAPCWPLCARNRR